MSKRGKLSISIAEVLALFSLPKGFVPISLGRSLTGTYVNKYLLSLHFNHFKHFVSSKI